MRSETSKCKPRLVKYCDGSGLDLGCGGDLIVRHAIGVDLEQPYTKVGTWPTHLHGDARKLVWFTDACMDFVFASHLLEDFPAEEIDAVLEEWLRVLKLGGYLIIYGPDEQIFRRHCFDTGQAYNANHNIDDFGGPYLAAVLERFSSLCVVHREDHCDDYCFEIVARKIRP